MISWKEQNWALVVAVKNVFPSIARKNLFKMTYTYIVKIVLCSKNVSLVLNSQCLKKKKKSFFIAYYDECGCFVEFIHTMMNFVLLVFYVYLCVFYVPDDGPLPKTGVGITEER